VEGWFQSYHSRFHDRTVHRGLQRLKNYKVRILQRGRRWRFGLYGGCMGIFIKNYIKSCSDKTTLFIICYLIQFILKIVQHVSNYVSLSSGTQFYYSSYRRTVLIKIHKLVDKMSLTVLSFWSLYLLFCVHHLFVSGVFFCDIFRCEL
jgi:hypothetical protein